MTLSYFRFLSEITSMNALSQIYSKHSWDLRTVEGITFLVCKVWKNETPIVHGSVDEFENETVEFEDEACSPIVLRTTVSYEYHIVYSEDYQVPVLYFQLRGSEGQLLPLEKIVSPRGEQIIASQQLHPHLDLPFFYLHPCQTAQFMSHLDTEGEGISFV
jgi:hypothetical protein